MPRTRTPLPTRRLAACAVALAALAACSGGDKGSRDASGEVVRAGSWSVYDLRRGDCLAPPKDAVEADTITVVPCASPHTQEVFATAQHTADAFPGIATLQAFGDVTCTTQLGTAIGASPSDGYFVSYLLPSFDSWNKRGDKTVTCVLVFPNEPNKTGSIVKSAIRAGKGEVAGAAAGTTTTVKG